MGSASVCFEKGDLGLLGLVCGIVYGMAWSKIETRNWKCKDVCRGRKRGIQCDDKQGIYMDTLVAVWGSLKQISTRRDNFLEPFVWDHF